MAREVWFEECGGVQVVCVSSELVEFADGRFTTPAPEHEVVLAQPLDGEQQAWVWNALVDMPEKLLKAALLVVGGGFLVYRADGSR